MTAEQLRNSLLQEAISGRLVPPACRQAGKTLTMNPTPHLQGKKVWFTYVIECEDGTFYKGFTDDLVKRYKQHCDGIGAEHTKIHKPKQLYYWEMHYSQKEAIAREKYLKSGSGREWFLREVVNKPENWEPASVLLEKIRDEKARLIKEGRRKKDSICTVIYKGEDNSYYEKFPDGKIHCIDDEIPYNIPESWEWERFGNIVINRDAERIPLSVEQRSKLAKIYDYYGASGIIDKVDRYLFNKDLLLIGEDGANLINRSTPIAFIAKGEYWVNNHAHVIDCINNIFMQYLCLYINAISLVDYVTGTAQPKMNQEKMNSIMVSIPPLAEQQRIVAKLEELLPIVEQYGKAQTELDELNAALPVRLRQSILQQAIQGKLVPQDPNEGTAEELLKQIEVEKQQLIKEKKLKKEKPSAPITDEEKPFEIPANWEWVRLKGIVFNHGQKNPDKRFSYIDIGSIDNKHQRLNSKESIIEAKDAPSRARKIVVRGDIIYSTVRPYLHNLAIVDKDFTEEPIVSTGFAVFSCFTGVYNKFLFYYLLSPAFDLYANNGDNAKGVAYPAINDDKLYKAIVPLPPLAEQQRIVAKIEELFTEIDKMK